MGTRGAEPRRRGLVTGLSSASGTVEKIQENKMPICMIGAGVVAQAIARRAMTVARVERGRKILLEIGGSRADVGH